MELDEAKKYAKEKMRVMVAGVEYEIKLVLDDFTRVIAEVSEDNLLYADTTVDINILKRIK